MMMIKLLPYTDIFSILQIYAAIEAMADGGVKMGLPRHLAQSLAAQTVRFEVMVTKTMFFSIQC